MKYLTGIKPTGKIHLGHYFSIIVPLLNMQEKGRDIFVLIADLHSITDKKMREKPEELRENTEELILSLVSFGLDPKKVKIYKQSEFEHFTLLKWVFDCLTTLPYVKRTHAFKELESKGGIVDIGTMTYPILQASDILLPDAEVVIIGKDQEQHLEISRDIARSFNNTYGAFFKEPKAEILMENTVPGTDGRKMSKSYKNVINIFDSEEEIRKQISKIVTDSSSIGDKKTTDENIIYKLYSLFNPTMLNEVKDKLESGSMSYKELKDTLADEVLSHFKEARENKNKGSAEKILKVNRKFLNNLFDERMKEIRKRIGV